MMTTVICVVALLASALTLFSGFGLGTLLLPAFAIFFPVELAVAMTAVVHFANNLFKLALVGRHADRGVVLRFGLPAVAAACAGAWLLGRLAHLPPWLVYDFAGRSLAVVPVKAVVGVLLLFFTVTEALPGAKAPAFDTRWLPLGGVLSGFFGGLSGNQGALRSVFLVRCGLTKEAFIGTGVVIACLVDCTRLGLYMHNLADAAGRMNYPLLAAATGAAFVGAYGGSRWLGKTTMAGIQRLVAGLLLLVGLGLAAGVL